MTRDQKIAAALRVLADAFDTTDEEADARRPPPPPPAPDRMRRRGIQTPPPAAKPDELTLARARQGLRKLGYRAGDAGNE